MALKYRSPQVYQRPDVRYRSALATKFINYLMHGGKKSVAERIFYRALEILESKVSDAEPMKVVEKAVENVRPMVEVRPRRVGGATYQVPKEVPKSRGVALALRWILDAARGHKGRPMHMRLAGELLDAYNRQGAAFTRRENVHKMAEANKAFAHFSW